MYICICNALCQNTIREAIGDDVHRADYEDIYEKLGCRPQCRRCEEAFCDFVDTLRLTKTLPSSASTVQAQHSLA